MSSGAFAEKQEGFFEDASVTLQAKNYYFMRDFSSIKGPSTQSKSEEWAQGFVLNAKSGYTPGVVGFGIDAIAMLGLKLDSVAAVLIQVCCRLELAEKHLIAFLERALRLKCEFQKQS